MTNKSVGLLCVGIVVVSGVIGAGIARHHYTTPTIKWYSDMTSQIQGRKIYLIDTPVSCPNKVVKGANGLPQQVPGRVLGEIKVDINLSNGELKVVENTVPATFKCE
jgi:hypothetical protein